jgi:hypothetical protein
VFNTNFKAEVPLLGDRWFSFDAITNILSYAEVRDLHRVSYDHDKDIFIVHLPTQDVIFERFGGGLYAHKPTIKQSATPVANAQFVTTLDENKKFYTERQFREGKRARDLFHALGTPSVHDLKAIIQMPDGITNCPVTTKHLDYAEGIFGPDIGDLKGKTTRRKPAPVVDDHVAIPRELIAAQYAVTLCLDGMRINSVPFLTTISKNIMYRTAQWVAHQTVEVYRKRISEVIRLYHTGGLRVTDIRCDNEFRPLVDPLGNEFNIRMNYANPQEHVPEAERNNRVIEERFRATFHRLPYEHFPRIMVKMLGSESAKKLNYFPSKNGVSPYYSPRMILHQRQLDYEKHCRYALGTYVQSG